jgi:amidophosphoribosyltransferase
MGRILTGISDIELLASLIAAFYDLTNHIFDALKKMMEFVRGAYSIVVLTKKGDILAIRDSIGYKPLCFGSLEREDKKFYVFASESCALDVIGAKIIDDVKPGEIVSVNPTESIRREQIIPHIKHGICSYEYIYFARPDSIIDGISVGKVRYNLGINLAMSDDLPSENAIVVPVPDSGRSAAMGYSWKSKIAYAEGLMKNRYLWQLKKNFNEKLNPIKAVIYNKDIVLIDDSIVSGITMKKIIKMLRDVGSKSIHVRISCPPLIKNCDLNDSLSNRDIFIALEAKIKNFDNFNEEMRKYIDADSLKYQSVSGLIDAIGKSENKVCSICLKEICDLDEEIIRNKIEIV